MAKKAETVSKKEARTKSELVREALRQYLWSAKWNELRSYGEKKGKKLGLCEEDVERLVDGLMNLEF